jgi:precorrin-3B C17-methyltransferase
MLDFPIGMLTIIFIGNSHTFVFEGLIVTPRGYARKYSQTLLQDPEGVPGIPQKNQPA